MNDLALPRFPELLDQTIIAARRWLVPLALPVALPITVATTAMLLLQMPMMAKIESGDFSGALASILPFGIVLILVVVFNAIGYYAVSIAALDALAGRPVSLGRAAVKVFTWSFLKTLLWNGLALFVAFLLCFFPILIAIPLLTLVIPVMIEERIYGLAALKRSAQLVLFSPSQRLVDGGFFLCCGLFLVGYSLSSALTLIAQVPLMATQFYLTWRQGLSGADADPMAILEQMIWVQAPAQAFVAVISVCIWLFFSFGSGMLYFHLRRRKEGTDLDLAVRNLRESTLA